MSKKIFQIISLILSVFTLVYLLLSHFGLIRYTRMYFDNCEKYIELYSSLPKKSKDKVVICFTIDNDNINDIKPFINSILDQSVKIDDIAMTVDYKNINKLDNTLKKVISPYGFSKDYEDSSNFIYSVLREPESDTKLILVEPYIIYGNDFIETMIEESNKYPNAIIFSKNEKEPEKGILIKPKFFNEKICLYKKGVGLKNWLKECSENIDVKYINYNYNYKKI